MDQVAVLFARHDSVYKTLPNVDVYDADRDARTYRGHLPVIAHPPCRAWGSLRHFAKPRCGERKLAIWSVILVRRLGGVIEHPAASRLWPTCHLPEPGERDAHGGWTLVVDQDWWGHRAEKRTRLYIVGCEPGDIPPMPIKLEEPPCVVSPWAGLRSGMQGYRPQLRKAEREHTPLSFAEWLIELARRCRKEFRNGN